MWYEPFNSDESDAPESVERRGVAVCPAEDSADGAALFIASSCSDALRGATLPIAGVAVGIADGVTDGATVGVGVVVGVGATMGVARPCTGVVGVVAGVGVADGIPFGSSGRR